MKREDLVSLLEVLQQDEMEINLSKGREYAQGDEDALQNFKVISKLVKLMFGADVSPEIVSFVYMAKHLLAIGDYVKHGDSRSNEPITGRVEDARLYLALLLGLLEDAADHKTAVLLRLEDTDGDSAE